MEMLLFYLIAIALSAYETNKSEKQYEKQARIDLSEIRDWFCHYERNGSDNRRRSTPASNQQH